MPVINNAIPLDEEKVNYAPSDMDIKHRGMSRDDVNSLIDSLCKSRMENPDVVLMDNIQQKNYDPVAQERYELEQDVIAVEDEVARNIFESGTPLSVEEINEFKANGIYDRYQRAQAKKLGKTVDEYLHDENNTMGDLEEELRANINKPLEGDIENITEVISEEEVIEMNTNFQNTNEEPETIVETTVVDNTEVNTELDAENVIEKFAADREKKKPLSKEQVNKVLALPEFVEKVNDMGESLVQDIKDEVTNKDEEEMSIEDFNDVPATEISLPDDVITNTLMEKYDNVSAKDALQLIDVMNRYKAHEKFNVFESLPDSIKSVILKEAADLNVNKSTVNFFAKTFINDLVNNTFLDQEIRDFNTELREVMAPMGNIVGTMMDEYNDEVYDKFTTKLLAKAEEIKDKDPEKAKQLKVIANNFEISLSMDRIYDCIENPTSINKAYKNARDRWNNVVREYNETISKTSPKPRSLEMCLGSLIKAGYPEDYAKTIVVLAKNSIIEAIKEGSLEEHVYAYYLSNSLYNLAFTANNSKAITIVKNNVDKIVDDIDRVMTPLKARNTKKNRKRNKKKK